MRRLSDQHGDTLVEVILAVAILSVVLIGAFSVANRSFLVGQSAKERTQASSLMQEQVEALRSYRDSVSWNSDFRPGVGPLGNDFHMALVGGLWRPQGGHLTGSFAGATSDVFIRTAEILDGGEKIRFEVSANWQEPGGGLPNNSTISTYLVRLDDLAPADCSAGAASC